MDFFIENCRSRSSAPIYNLSVTRGAVLFSRMNSPDVEIWDSVKERVGDSFSMTTLFGYAIIFRKRVSMKAES